MIECEQLFTGKHPNETITPASRYSRGTGFVTRISRGSGLLVNASRARIDQNGPNN